MFDRQMRCLAMSQRFLADYPSTESNVIGKCVYEIFPEVPDRWKQVAQRCLSGVSENCAEDRFDRADGSTHWMRWEMRPWHEASGEIGGLILFTEDISEQQRIFQKLQSTAMQLQEANGKVEREREQLAERVAERTADLEVANQKLFLANRFKSEFLATMSHELRTPLNGVLGMNELLLKTPLSDKQREFVDASNISCRTLLNLVNDVLDISKIEAGKLEFNNQICDFELFIYDTLRIFAFNAEQESVSLACRLDPETCATVMCDETRLRQILVNLLGNALKFTAHGDVVLETIVKGETVSEVLDYVQFHDRDLIHRLQSAVEVAVREGRIDHRQAGRFVKFYEAGLQGYTYLEEISGE